MSNERHQEINKGTMGTLFRRMTMASLGLDAMEDVSEQSFEVIDRADAFAQRLMGGVSQMMPRGNFEDVVITNATDALWEDLYANILPENSPKSATDVGEWQYWLDAVLLTLFDEDEEEEEASLSGTTSTRKASAAKQAQIMRQKAQIRERVAALNASGVRPGVLNGLASSKKRAIVQSLKEGDNRTFHALLSDAAESVKKGVSAEQYTAAISEFSSSLLRAYEEGGKEKSSSALAASSEQIFASRLLESVSRLESATRVRGEASTETDHVMKMWRENVQRFGRSSHRDGSDIIALHEMQRLVGEMSDRGIVSESVAKRFKGASRTFASRALDNVISRELSRSLASRLEQSAHSIVSRNSEDVLVSSVAVKPESVVSIDAAKSHRAESALIASLDHFVSIIRSYVEKSGENAATMRFSRASERFEQMQGASDLEDRVLLKDLIESAGQLEASGVLPKGAVSRLIKSATNAAVDQLAVSGNVSDQIEMLQRISASTVQMTEDMRVSRAEKVSRQFGTLLSNVSKSLDTFMSEMSGAGLKSGMIEPVARDIALLKNIDDLSVEEKLNRVELLSRTLDEFVDNAMATLPEQGYDDLIFDSTKTYVSPEEAAVSGIETRPSAGSAANLQQLRQYLGTVEALRAETESKFAELLHNEVVHNAKISSSAREEIVRALESRNVEQLLAAKEAVRTQLTQAVNEQIEAASVRMEEQRQKYASLARQASQIERAAELSRMLRVAGNSTRIQRFISSPTLSQATSAGTQVIGNPADVKSIAFGGTKVDGSYLPVLNETLTAYAKLRDDLINFDTMSIRSFKADETLRRLERMTSLLQVSENRPSFEAAESAPVSRAEGFATQIGYDEIVPEAMDKVQNVASTRGYASTNSVSSYASMMGARKALGLHANGLAEGHLSEVNALASVLNSDFAEEKAQSYEPVSMVTVNESGERVRVTIGSVGNKSDNLELRHNIGEAYQPAVLRGQNANAVTPSVDIKKLDNVSSISGAEQFVSVILGQQLSAARRSSGESSGVADSISKGFVNASENITGRADSYSDRADSFSGAGSFSGDRHERFEEISAEPYEGEHSLLNVSVAGTKVAMTPEAYVQSVAESKISSSARELSLGSDALYESLASVLSQQGSSRSLRSLRRRYFEKLSEAGQNTAHGWLGLNTQSYANLLGISSKASGFSGIAYDSESGEFLKSDIAERAEKAFKSSFGMDAISSDESVSYNTDDVSRSFVSADVSVNDSLRSRNYQASDVSYGSQILRNVAQMKAETASAKSGNPSEFLGSIESLLDYVEEVSNRNVGVFSSNDVVRVLVEQLPKDSYLGERGLPKWRQKDTKARQVEEARELRDALSKIGANPVQGVARYNDKKFVSPNLMPQANDAAPLFSGGSDGGSGSSASSSNGGAASLDNGNLPTNDLQIIAEEIYEMILDSLNEELQRRRSE